MFVQFRSAYSIERHGDVAMPWLADGLASVAGYSEFSAEFAGASFDDGLYRVHGAASGAVAQQLVSDAFPEYRDRVTLFGFDWLGRQFAVDFGRTEDGQPLVLMLEPGTGEALEIPVNFVDFHNEELVNFPDDALARSFFRQWVGSRPDTVPLGHSACIGYRVPLFLGGDDTVENLELSDIEVYWSLFGQLRMATRDLLPSSTIDEVRGRGIRGASPRVGPPE